jgi:type II secretory pathway pseudopilin PulG
MTLEELYYISQIIAVIAIIGSLVAIYFQQAQTNKIARAQITQNASASFQGAMRELMTPELAPIFRKVMFERAPLTPVETTQILVYFNLTLTSVRDAFLAVRADLFDQRLLDAMVANVCWYLTAPVFAAEWRRCQRTGIYGQDFATYLNDRLAKYQSEPGAAHLTPGSHEPHA